MSLWAADRSRAAPLTVDDDLDAARVWRRHTVVSDAFKFLRLMPLDFCDFQKLAFAHETVCEDKRREGDWIPAPWCTMSYVSVIGLEGVPEAAALFQTVMLNKKRPEDTAAGTTGMTLLIHHVAGALYPNRLRSAHHKGRSCWSNRLLNVLPWSTMVACELSDL